MLEGQTTFYIFSEGCTDLLRS